MTSTTRDARFFVEGVTKYLRMQDPPAGLLPKVNAALHKITASARREKTARVESVVALTVLEKQAIARVLSRLLTHTVTIEGKINKDLLGGLRITVGDWIVDTSLAAQIDAMNEQLLA